MKRFFLAFNPPKQVYLSKAKKCAISICAKIKKKLYKVSNILNSYLKIAKQFLGIDRNYHLIRITFPRYLVA